MKKEPKLLIVHHRSSTRGPSAFRILSLRSLSLLLLLFSSQLQTALTKTTTTFAHSKFAEHPRYKRQFGGGTPETQIDLNITVPFIFSARLYPYGPERGDNELPANVDYQAFVLKNEFKYFDRDMSVLYILRDGAIGFDSDVAGMNRKQQFPRGKKSVAVHWAPNKLGNTGKVYFRETEDRNVLSLAASEVALQYKYAESFRPKSVFIVTWENVAPPDSPDDLPLDQRNTFQISLILSDNGTFAHVVYSKLKWHDLSVAGFNEGDGGSFLSLPGSGTPASILLANESDIGIPGEWLFKLDESFTYLCGPGYKGLECIQKCAPGEWYYDCSRRCHCAEDRSCCRDPAKEKCQCPCDISNGRCQTRSCSKGWSNHPTCDLDIDECEVEGPETLCPVQQPDCVNTPGAYLCMCLTGFDNATNSCRGSEGLAERPNAPNRRPAPAVTQAPLKVNTPRLIVPVLVGKLPVRTRGNVATATAAPRRRPPAPRPAPRTTTTRRPVTTTVTTRRPSSRNRRISAAPNRRFRSGDGVTVIPLRVNLPSSRRRQPGSSNRRKTTTSAPSAPPSGGGADDYDYEYGSFDDAALGSAPLGNIQPRTPTRSTPPSSPRRRSFFPTARVITPRIIQPVTLAPGVNPFAQPRTNPPQQPEPPRPEEPREGGSFTEAENPFEATPCTLRCKANARCATTHSGAQQCVCQDGYEGDGEFCVDINECFGKTGKNRSPCGPHARCVNEPGSHTCVCDDGFQISEDGTCVDVDECGLGTDDCPGGNSSSCVNIPGSFECQCKPGYNGNPGSILGCIDINECLIPEFYCGQNADCENTQGGFRCSCVDGFSRNEEGSGCVDIDECARAPCDSAAVCLNLDGGFECRCLQGYAGDGFSCAETILFPFESATDRKLPNVLDSVVEVRLKYPMKVFGIKYDRVYISANGIVSWDEPFRAYRNAPLDQLGMVMLTPLYLKSDLPTRGNVYFKETTEQSSITRGSLNVQEDFHEPSFRAKSVFVVTFEDVATLGDPQNEAGNTFQMVLVNGEDATYVTYIYDNIVVANPQSGINNAALEGSMVILPPSSQRDSSNIGQPGKWMFRIDQPEGIVPCPAGLTGPPLCRQSCTPGFWGQNCAAVCRCAGGIPCDFSTGVCSNQQCQPGYEGPACQQDIDECLDSDLNRCDSIAAECTNTPGGYSCRCKPGYEGDGFVCREVNTCYAAYGYDCSREAVCRIDITGQPVCVCNSGFIGDGFSCQRVDNTIPRTDNNIQQPFGPPEPIGNGRDPPAASPSASETTPPSLIGPAAGIDPIETISTSTAYTATISATPSPQPIEVNPTLPVSPPIRPNDETPSPPKREEEKEETFVENRQQPDQAPNLLVTPPPRRLRTTTTDLPAFVANNAITDSDDGTEPPAPPSRIRPVLVIIIPAVLCGVWLILIVILLVVCLRRRKQKKRQKFGGLNGGFYMPPSSSSQSGKPVMGGSSAYGTYSAASGWSIPRPNYAAGPADTYYTPNGSYYPPSAAGGVGGDPYGHYKY